MITKLNVTDTPEVREILKSRYPLKKLYWNSHDKFEAKYEKKGISVTLESGLNDGTLTMISRSPEIKSLKRDLSFYLA